MTREGGIERRDEEERGEGRRNKGEIIGGSIVYKSEGCVSKISTGCGLNIMSIVVHWSIGSKSQTFVYTKQTTILIVD